MTEIKNKYTHSEEVANAASHLVGTIMSIVVCSLFLHKAYQADNTLAVVSMSLYFFGVVRSYVAIKPLYESVGLKVVLFIVAEGLSYIIGAVFYSFKKTKYMHFVFHVFVVLGDVFHMLAVWNVIE